MSEQSEAAPNRRLEWAKVIVIPLTVAAATVGLGFWTDYQESERDDQRVDAVYVDLAIGILSGPPSEADLAEPLRAWAFEVLRDNSPTALPDDLVERFDPDDAMPVFPSTQFRFCNVDTNRDGVRDRYRDPLTGQFTNCTTLPVFDSDALDDDG